MSQLIPLYINLYIKYILLSKPIKLSSTICTRFLPLSQTSKEHAFNAMDYSIKVAILDDHLSIIDGYISRLGLNPLIEVVATASFGDELNMMLERQNIDILVLDIDVPTSSTNKQKFPIPPVIPKILDQYPDMQILIISMHEHKSLIKTLMENGTSGYILKDDNEAISNLSEIIIAIFNGEIYISDNLLDGFRKDYTKEKPPTISERQYAILSICLDKPDIKTKEIAESLSVAHSTVRNNLSRLYLNLGVNSRHAAILKAQEIGLLPPRNMP